MPEPIVEIREPGRRPIRLALNGPIELGRECDGVLLTDPLISRRHVELRPSEAGVTLTDLGSSNGTVVDGNPISGPVVLAPGEVARMGAVTITVAEARRVETANRRTEIAGSPDLRATSIGQIAEAVVEQVEVPEHEHHHGTITIVFSDIEESTSRLAQVGDATWMRQLHAHNVIITGVVAAHGGAVIKHQGDGFMLTFPSARRAVQAALDVHDEIAAGGDELGGMRVRVGMHTGEVIVEDGDIFGAHVNIAARIANEATGGEVLVSSLTKAILETRGDLVFGPPRPVPLKGLDGLHDLHPVSRA